MYADHVRSDPRHPYIERLPTLWTHIHLTYVTTLLSQIKCVRYWPEKLHESLTVENKFRVTFSSNMPFAEYEFRKFKLENVSTYTISSS